MLEQSALIQGIGIGFHQVPFTWGHPLCWMFWGVFLLGCFTQWVVLRRMHQRWAYILVPVLLVAGMFVSDVACHTITGWDLLLPLGIYWLLLAALLGALLCTGLVYLKRRKERD